MTGLLMIALLVTSILLLVVVSLQPKSEGLSLSGSSSANFTRFEKRGAELVLHRLTIALAAVFVLLSIALYLLG